MAKRRIILGLVVCLSLTVLTVQTLPQAPSSNRISKPPDTERLRNMTEEEKKRELAKRRRQKKLESEQRRKESAKRRAERPPRPKFDREQWLNDVRKKNAEIKKGFLYEKYALRPTEEQWKVIKPMLEKVQRLRNQARSTVGFLVTSSSGSGTSPRDSRSRNEPNWQWRVSWKDKAPGELTEAQKIANELMDLVDNKYTTAEEFKQKMDALRKSRLRQEKLERQLSEAQQELREVLTTRQEAALVLKKWL